MKLRFLSYGFFIVQFFIGYLLCTQFQHVQSQFIQFDRIYPSSPMSNCNESLSYLWGILENSAAGNDIHHSWDAVYEYVLGMSLLIEQLKTQTIQQEDYIEQLVVMTDIIEKLVDTVELTSNTELKTLISQILNKNKQTLLGLLRSYLG